MDSNPPKGPVVLCILDGWGHREDRAQNAVALAATPTYDRLVSGRPMSLLDASEHHVGLPSGQMGNSEVGHMNIGAGRRVLQDLPRINDAIAEGRLAETPALKDFIERLRESGGKAHILGLLSPGGVHAHQDHIAEIVALLTAAGIDCRVHAFLDGRDTPPESAAGFLEDFAAKVPQGAIATLSGRYYAMDRDHRWDRVAKAYAAIAEGKGPIAAEPVAAVVASCRDGTSDEFLLPTVIGDYEGLSEGDGVFMANFRSDRSREILEALLDPDFTDFPRARWVNPSASLGMVSYSSKLDGFLAALFPSANLEDTLGEVVAAAGQRQLRIAETEKYPHVTFFLNGGREEPFAGETRILVPSPKVATYDLKPEMSAPEVTDRLVEAIESGRFDLLICNYANGDMVGHSGKLDAAIKAVEVLDKVLARLVAAVTDRGGALLITADHGNCEEMRDPKTGAPHTAHTMNAVPFILAAGADESALADGCLADIAPTLLELLALPKPIAMTGRSLLRRSIGKAAAE